MNKEFHQAVWNEELEQDWLRILDLAVREDLGSRGRLHDRGFGAGTGPGQGGCRRSPGGRVGGAAAIDATLARFSPRLGWSSQAHDGQALAPRQSIGSLEGPARAILAVERPLLNMLGRLSGIASLTRRYVDAVSGTSAGIYDTRKTTPGWRSLEKYAVRCGGGRNHRAGLFEAVLIKDNHLALGAELRPQGRGGYGPGEAVLKARQFLVQRWGDAGRQTIVEIEVDTLAQLDEVLAADPDLILLDNMSPAMLREAVARRDSRGAAVELEASGGIDLGTVCGVEETGVDRISVGAMTHSAVALDFGLDWNLTALGFNL